MKNEIRQSEIDKIRDIFAPDKTFLEKGKKGFVSEIIKSKSTVTEKKFVRIVDIHGKEDHIGSNGGTLPRAMGKDSERSHN